MPATSRSRRIAFCITELDPGGAEEALLQIVLRLDRRQWDPRVYSLSGDGVLADRLTSAGIEVRQLKARSRWDLMTIGRLTRLLQDFRPEVLQTFLFHANVAGSVAAGLARVPVMVTGARVVEPNARWRMHLETRTHRLQSHRACVSESVATAFRQIGFPAEKLSVISNGVEFERFADATPADLTRFGVPASARAILSVGRLHPQKGVDLLVEAVAAVFSEIPDVHLLIAGEGPQREQLRKRIGELSTGERIHLLGRQEDIAGLMRSSAAFVLASRWEGMPNVMLEAMAAGLPIVATRVEGVPELIEHEISGLIIRPGAVAALKDAMLRLLSDGDLAAALGRAAQNRVQTSFSWGRAAQQYCELWERLLCEAGRDAAGSQ
jgi:glycosyltransferase involved in cell wall biosynthesis